jgi:hypothetical protein
MLGMLGAKWEIGDPPEILPCLSAVDAVVHPDHRRKGLLRSIWVAGLRELASSAYRYNIVPSANRISAAAAASQGWSLVTPFEEVRRRMASRSMSDRLERYVRSLPMTPSARPRGPFEALEKNYRSGSYVSVARESKPAAMADLIHRNSCDGRMRHVRDKEYLTWCYRNPFSTYRFLFWERDRLDGYLVLQAWNLAGRDGVNIADWEVASAEIWADLLDAAIGWGRFESLTTWSATLGDETKALLLSRGFEPVVQSAGPAGETYAPALLIRLMRPAPQASDWVVAGRKLLDPESWDLRPIYSDDL